MATQFALITGASSGIGLSLAKEFARAGFDLAICSETAAIKDAAADLRTLGVNVTDIQADLSTFEGVEQLVREVAGLSRPLDAVALNAGVGLGGDFVRQTDLLQEMKMISLNVTSTVHLAKRLLKDMVARGEGRVLFTASIASTMPGTYSAVYNATKAFVLSFAEAIREELRDTGVTITALMPGATDTNFFHRAGMDRTKVGASEKVPSDVVAKQGFAALMAGEDSVIGGSVKVKLQGTANELLPETTKAAAHAGMAKPEGAGDVVDILKAQHEQVKSLFKQVLDAKGLDRKQLFDKLKLTMQEHETAEQEVVHPVAQTCVSDGPNVVEKHLAQEREADALLAELSTLSVDLPIFESRLKELQKAVVAHAESEERNEFSQLEGKLDEAQLRSMAKRFDRAEATVRAAKKNKRSADVDSMRRDRPQ